MRPEHHDHPDTSLPAALENDIARARKALDAWLDESYSGREGERYYGENDASYPGWRWIEETVGRAFDTEHTQQLSETAVGSVLFFISRSDEIAAIINWLRPAPGTRLSSCGKLSRPEFLFLCEQAANRKDDRCDHQLVACFQKFDALDDHDIDILLRFFQKQDSYTRRNVLDVFARFGLPQVVDLATALWQTDDDEFAKLSCLYALKTAPEGRQLFETYLREYQNTFDVSAEDYRQSHMQHLVET